MDFMFHVHVKNLVCEFSVNFYLGEIRPFYLGGLCLICFQSFKIFPIVVYEYYLRNALLASKTVSHRDIFTLH